MYLDHLSLYVKNVTVSRTFYEAVLLPNGWKLVRDFGEIAVGFGHENYAELALVREKTRIQSSHLAFKVDNRSAVDSLYLSAIEAGASDNGAPGLRPHYHESYYAAFVLDPDGHNIEFVCHRSQVD